MKPVLFFFILALVCAACSPRGEEQRMNLSELSLTEMDGSPVRAEDLRGKTVFVNTWATWCKPCLKEFPGIAALMTRLNRDDILFLFASSESPEEIRAFQARYDYPFHYLVFENSEEIGISVLPTTFIFDAKGNLRHREDGYRDWESQQSLDLLLEIAKK